MEDTDGFSNALSTAFSAFEISTSMPFGVVESTYMHAITTTSFSFATTFLATSLATCHNFPQKFLAELSEITGKKELHHLST